MAFGLSVLENFTAYFLNGIKTTKLNSGSSACITIIGTFVKSRLTCSAENASISLCLTRIFIRFTCSKNLFSQFFDKLCKVLLVPVKCCGNFLELSLHNHCQNKICIYKARSRIATEILANVAHHSYIVY